MKRQQKKSRAAAFESLLQTTRGSQSGGLPASGAAATAAAVSCQPLGLTTWISITQEWQVCGGARQSCLISAAWHPEARGRGGGGRGTLRSWCLRGSGRASIGRAAPLASPLNDGRGFGGGLPGGVGGSHCRRTSVARSPEPGAIVAVLSGIRCRRITWWP